MTTFSYPYRRDEHGLTTATPSKVTLTLIFKTRDGDIQQRATADKPRKAYAQALDGIIRRFPAEAWLGTDYPRAAYNAFEMALNAPRGTACCTPWTIVYID